MITTSKKLSILAKLRKLQASRRRRMFCWMAKINGF